MRRPSARRMLQIKDDMSRHHGYLDRSTDPQRYALYRAVADTFYSSRLTISRGMRRAEEARPEFAGVAEAQEYLRGVQRSAFVREHWPRTADAPCVVVKENRESGAATVPETQVIELAHDGMALTRYAALHEMAHLVMVYERELYDSGLFFKADRDSAHGPRYAGIHMKLVQEFLPERAAALSRAYKRHNVKVEEI